jgi:hypothetical protein
MAETNGKGPQVKRREKWLDLPAEYEGFRVKVWVNAPTRLWVALQAADVTEQERQAAAMQLVLETNGWQDFDGAPYPPPSEIKFWEEIPTELAACVFAGLRAEIGRLPNSLAPTNRR